MLLKAEGVRADVNRVVRDRGCGDVESGWCVVCGIWFVVHDGEMWSSVERV